MEQKPSDSGTLENFLNYPDTACSPGSAFNGGLSMKITLSGFVLGEHPRSSGRDETECFHWILYSNTVDDISVFIIVQ